MDEQIGSSIAQVARLMRRHFDELARAIGVTRPQWQVLTLVGRNEGINQGGIADLLEVEPITVGRMVDRLQESGLVERRADPADRRAWRLFVTPLGRDLLGQLQPCGAATVALALDGVEPQERETLRLVLERMRMNLSRKPAESASHG